ncbi:hypothetical protein R3W88_022558 [Solanum pinnatisectum]|uniref:Uncharacterized protein n=1 Tax=Solanum pinnatisectum TaxID=50273 RepID=A0AAV9LXW9_9SOLN|nr:hypothetical protein R3W88_022558 [Solanum pinnatisectum]
MKQIHKENIKGIRAQHKERYSVLQHTNDKFYTGDSTEKQQDKTEKAIWKVKEKISINETAINSNKENGGNRPHTNSMEKTGKSVNFASENNAHNPLILNNPNEQEKGHISMQAAVKEIGDLTVKAGSKGINIDNHAPPPIKISSNFDIHRPSQQKTNPLSPKQNQNMPSGNNASTKNITLQIPDPSHQNLKP